MRQELPSQTQHLQCGPEPIDPQVWYVLLGNVQLIEVGSTAVAPSEELAHGPPANAGHGSQHSHEGVQIEIDASRDQTEEGRIAEDDPQDPEHVDDHLLDDRPRHRRRASASARAG